MKEIYLKCTLLSDIVLNSQLATEGNMQTLDYIPGSNFLGIAAKELYSKLKPEESLEVFHSGKIIFGDARYSPISIEAETIELSYKVPLSYFMVKGKDKLEANDIYLHHLINSDNHPKKNGEREQLKSKREGIISAKGRVIDEVSKSFFLKSAHDMALRRSKEGAMFGFESLPEGGVYLFSVMGENEELLEKIIDSLVGVKRVGKSKSAQFGEVKIERVESDKVAKIGFFENSDFSLVYAESDLIFFDNQYDQPTFQPTAEQMGLKGEIDWAKSQIRTNSHSPWNGKRNSTDSQRDAIIAGSVFFINHSNTPGKRVVGEHKAEGFGKIIVNPVFLEGDIESGKLTFPLKRGEKPEVGEASKEKIEAKTALAKFLSKKKEEMQMEFILSKTVTEAVASTEFKELKDKKITPSQWGSIRSYATKYLDTEELQLQLFGNKNNGGKIEGYLTHGVAYDTIWGSKREKLLKKFRELFNEYKGEESPIEPKYFSQFLAKYAAEMAKKSQQ